MSTRPRRYKLALTFAAALVLVAGVAEARPGKSFGGGFGSRGSRTFDAPPATQTAPRTAAPIERSATPQNGPGFNQGVQSPTSAAGRGGFFGNRGGFMGGLLGAGLLGMMLGYGFSGGLGGIGSMLGLLLQVALVVWLARLAFRFFQSRNQPVAAGAPLQRDMASPARPNLGSLGGGAAPRTSRKPDEVGIGKADLDSFEQLLGTIQTAYGRDDRATLRASTTPEMGGYFDQELAGLEAQGLRNVLSEPRLLQGDLAEAWREGNSDFATVAMRFSLRDHTEERATGRVVDGDPAKPTEATELWTFVRPRGGRWLLSAIQQA